MRKIISDPEIRGGKPVFRGTRISPLDILAFWKEGLSDKEILKEYPAIEPFMIEETKRFVIEKLREYRDSLKEKAKRNKNFRRRLILLNGCLTVLEGDFKDPTDEAVRGCLELAEEVLRKSFFAVKEGVRE